MADKTTIKRIEKYTINDFIISETNCGVTVRWKHNHRAIKLFRGYQASMRANAFVNWLICWLNNPDNASLSTNKSRLLEIYKANLKATK
jgi:hypothetical protein